MSTASGASPSDHTLSEQLVLVAYNPEAGKPRHVGMLDQRVAGAALVELALRGAVTVEGASRRPERRRIAAVPGARTGEERLDEALAEIAAKSRSASSTVSRLSRRMRRGVLEDLAAAGILEPRRARVLGLFPVTRWPAVDTTPGAALRSRLAEVLLERRAPTERESALIALTADTSLPTSLVAREDGRRALARAKAIRAEQSAAGRAGGDAQAAVDATVEAIRAAVVAAVIAGTVASTASVTSG